MIRSLCLPASAALGALAASVALGQELVSNGGFETGGFFPWNAPPAVFPPQPDPQLFLVSGGGGHTGTYYAQLSSTQLRYVSQVLPTTAGADYELSFWLRIAIHAPEVLRIRWEGQPVFTQSILLPDSTNWYPFTLPLHSSINGSLLEFGQNVFPGVFHLDDVSVRPVPAPGGAAVLLIGGAAAAVRRRRRGGTG